MKTRLRAALALTLLMTAAGCASISAVPAGPVALGEGRSVNLQRTWSDVSGLVGRRQPKVRVLSIDGPLLNRLYLVDGLSSGEGLIKRAAKEKPVPVFKADMSPTEQVEFVADSVTALGYQRVETTNLRPGHFGPGEALRFELSALTENGLEISGSAKLAVIHDRLYLVMFLAPSEHYFPAASADLDAMMEEATAHPPVARPAAAPVAPPPAAATPPPAPIAPPPSTAAPKPAPVSAPPTPNTPADHKTCGLVRQNNGSVKLLPCH